MDHEFFVSGNATCSDRLESGLFHVGDTIYVCQNVANKGTESFEVQAGNTSNDIGTDLSGLEGGYTPRDSAGDIKTVVNSFVAGSGLFAVGSHVFNSAITVTGIGVNFTSGDTLTSAQTINVTINSLPDTPSLTNPVDGITSGDSTPALTGSTFNDSDAGDTHANTY